MGALPGPPRIADRNEAKDGCENRVASDGRNHSVISRTFETRKRGRIAKEVFKSTPDGIPGNDDLGATSGVYVWNALGFYPAVPGVGGLVLGTPMFDKVTLELAAGRKLVISRKGAGIYVQQVLLDGKNLPISTRFLPFHSDLYLNCLKNSPQATSAIPFAKQ